MRHLVWLASYPKSGNTWMRAFLTAYLAGPGVDVDVNRLDAGLHAASRQLFDRVIGFPSSDLTADEIDDLRPGVYRAYNDEVTEPLFIKVHDAWRRNRSGEAVFPADATRAAVVIVRNPLAVAPSLASHSNQTIDEAIERMGRPHTTLAPQSGTLTTQLPQPMGTWTEQVDSWLTQDELPVHLVRYEQLRAEPRGTFSAVLAACGIDPDPDLVDDALDRTRFERLQRAEQSDGFRERVRGAQPFFRRGSADGWRDELTDAQARRIVEAHGPLMARLGYDPAVP